MDPLEQFKATFFEECHEYLEDVEQELSGLSPETADNESLNAIFRAVHSIKGGAGTFGFDQLIEFTHRFESVLDLLRSHELEITDESVDVLLASSDVQVALVEAAENDETVNEELVSAATEMLDAILNGDSTEGADPGPAAGETENIETLSEPDATAAETLGFKIGFKPHPDMIRRANEPLLILRELASHGDMTIEADCSTIPALEDIDPEGAYLSWSISLTTDASEDEFLEAFEFISDDCDFDVSPLTDDTSDTQAETGEMPDIEPDEFGFVPVPL